MSANPYAGNVRKLYAIRFCAWMHTVAAVLVPFFRDWGGVPLGGILLLNAWFMAWSFLLEVPTGTVADRFGRKTSLVLGTALGAIATGVYVSAPVLGVFLVGEILFAMSYALNSGADEALLYESLGPDAAERAPRAFARLESFKLAGICAGALCGSVLASELGLRVAVAAQMVPMALGVGLALTLREPPRHAPGEQPRRYADTLREGLRHFADDPALRPLAVDAIAIGALCFLVIWLYQPLLEAAGIGVAAFGGVHVALCVGQILVLGSLGRLTTFFGSRAALLRGAALTAGACFVALAVARHPAAVVALVVACASFGLSRTPILNSAMNHHLPSAHRATVLSVVSGLRMLGIVIVNGLTSLGVGRSLHGTALALGLAILALAALSPVRETHLGSEDA
ncbi:MAG TPA: MFS transporter [Myxococcota bacterium]|nr:MFS transporter [Myxococcota bacterium]